MGKSKVTVGRALRAAARFLPPLQFKHIQKHLNLYIEELNSLAAVVKKIPKLRAVQGGREPKTYLHYFSGSADYFICQYDGDDTFYGKAKMRDFPDDVMYRKFSLANLKSNQFLELELGREK
jgi:hypothetical protein